MKQKLSGLVMIAIGVISVMLLADATFAVIAVPLGLYLIVTKEKFRDAEKVSLKLILEPSQKN